MNSTHRTSVIVAVALLLLAGVASSCGSLDVSSAAVLEEMRAYFGADVTGAEVKGSPGDVRIDVYTAYYPDSDMAAPARNMAAIAAQLGAVTNKYPSTTITAYVWPKGKEFYVSRATATYEDGRMTAPMDIYVNSGLE